MKACFLLIAGCPGLEAQPYRNEAAIAVSFTDHLSLNWMLEAPLTVNTQEELQEQLFQPWEADVKVGRHGEQTVAHCQDFFLAEKRALEPVKPNEFVSYRLMGAGCKAVSLSLALKDSTESYLGAFALNKALAEKLPPELAFFVSASRKEAVLADPRVQSWADVDKIVAVKRTNKHQAVFVDSDGNQREFFVLARGDYNADGVEDILVKSVNSVSGGSYVSVKLYVLTRYKHNDRYTLLDLLS